ncbi:hypothetical protein QYF36_026352 [Acer negundo]|nr:hypothetical protein QYF36_026352 [Acer negundo]
MVIDVGRLEKEEVKSQAIPRNLDSEVESGPSKAYVEEEPNININSSTSCSDNPGISHSSLSKPNRAINNKKRRNSKQFRDLGISKGDSEVLCGKRKFTPEEIDGFYGRWKARKIEGSNNIESNSSIKGSKSVSVGRLPVSRFH